MSMLCTCIRGQMSNTFFQSGGGGANVHPCQSLGGQMSLYTIFHRGADVRGGECPSDLSSRFIIVVRNFGYRK